MKRFSLLLLFLCVSIPAFSAEEETIIPYVLPSDSSTSERDVESKIRDEISAIKAEYSNDFLAYGALRENNLSLCGGSNSGCNRVVEGGLNNKLWAQGKCNEVADLTERKICEGIKNNCSNISGWKAEFCKAFIANDVDALSNSLQSRDAMAELKENLPTANDLAWSLALYSGFKYSNPALCQAILDNSTFPLEERMVCYYIFSSKPVNQDELIRDLAIFRLSKIEKNTEYCALIKSDLIKSECVKK